MEFSKFASVSWTKVLQLSQNSSASGDLTIQSIYTWYWFIRDVKHPLHFLFTKIFPWRHACLININKQYFSLPQDNPHQSSFRIMAEAGPSKPSSSTTDSSLSSLLEQGGFAVYPLPWCPHLDSLPSSWPDTVIVTAPCETCQDASENWMCLSCNKILCSRWEN